MIREFFNLLNFQINETITSGQMCVHLLKQVYSDFECMFPIFLTSSPGVLLY